MLKCFQNSCCVTHDIENVIMLWSYRYGIINRRLNFARVRDKTQLLRQLQRSTRQQDCHFFIFSILFKMHCILSRTRQSTIPSFAFLQFRKCAFYALIMHDQIIRRVIYVLDGCSILYGMLFQLIWNPVPDEMEQDYILAVTKQKFKKFTTRVCKVVNESWRLEV